MVYASRVHRGLTARSLMTPNPVSLNEHLTLREAALVLTNKDISAAPVIDDAGRPVGVLSRTDIIRHSSGDSGPRRELPEAYEVLDPTAPLEIKESSKQMQVWQVLNPLVLSVNAKSSLTHVVKEFLVQKVHRLFVVDDEGTLIGVITALDLLRRVMR